MRTGIIALPLLALLTLACGGGATAGGAGAHGPNSPGAKPKPGAVTQSGSAVSSAAAASYEKALDEFVGHDKKNDWAEATCVPMAKAFLDAGAVQQSTTGKPFPEAHYNAGLAYARCDKDAEARGQFEAALKADPNFHRAAGQIALYDYVAKKLDLDGVIRKLEEIIRAAKFQNVEALVSVAALQLERASDTKDKDGRDDFANAQLNLQRALAIDDSYMPAFNQLAIYYLERAKAGSEKDKKAAKGKKRRGGLVVAGARTVEVNQQQLDLAALVAGQAVRKNPNYAPIHNTAGLIQVELRNFNGAVKSFASARRLDPKFFEAHMNYAAVNLSFRGFGEAEKAYRDALKLRPNEFEAHLGLALALRGQINDANYDSLFPQAKQHIEAARKLEPNRAETYYNEAILVQEYEAKSAPDAQKISILERAATLYQQFIGKAGTDPVFSDAAKRAKDRAQDIKDIIAFMKAGEEERKRMEEEEKQRAAQQGPPAAPGGETPPEGAPPAGGGEAPPPGGGTPAQ